MNLTKTKRFLRQSVINLLLLGAGLFASVVLIEIGLQIFLPSEQMIHMRDPYIGKRFIPNGTFAMEGIGWSSTLTTNSLGWNAPEFTVQKPAGLTRIVHIGDSITQGAHVNTDKTFASLIGTLLPATESLNLGLAGNGTYPEFLTYRHYAKTYAPDVIFMWFSDNDFRDNYLVHQVVNTDEGAPVPSYKLGWLRSLLLEKLKLPKLLYQLLAQNRLVVSTLIKTGLLSMEPQEFSDDIPLIYRTTVLDTPERAKSLTVTRHIFKQLKDDVKEGELVIGYVASYFESNPQGPSELQKLYPSIDLQKIDRGFPQRAIKTLAKELDIPFVDLTDTFRNSYAKGGVPHIPNDGHLAAEGHELVAKTVAAWLQEHNMCCGVQLNTAVQTEQGDFLQK